MKTSRLLGFLTALMLLVAVDGCTTYVSSRPNYVRRYGYQRRPYYQPATPPPPRPYVRVW